MTTDESPASPPPDPTTTPPTRRLHRVAAIAAGLAVAILTISSSVASAAPPPAIGAAHQSSPGGVVGVPVPVLRWVDAGDGYQQSYAAVPYDYAQPRGRTFRLHLVRLPASDPQHKIGTLFVNFGGPGAPAASAVRAFGRYLLDPAVLARYDLVGVDPRGTGRSQPVRCVPDDQVQRFPYATGARFPVTRAQSREAVAQARHFARECRARNGDLLDHVGTLQFARDLDVLRAAMGDRRINLLGLSYGTFLGQVVANTFPSRTGALILDAVVDPAWASGPGNSVSWIRENGDRGSWETMGRFFQLCAQAGRSRCAFADGNPERKFATLAHRLRAEPLRVPLADGTEFSLGYAELISGLSSSSGLYESFGWARVAELLQAAYVQDLPEVARVIEALVAPPPPGLESYASANTAISCADTDNPRSPSRYGRVGRERDLTVAPYFGSRWAYLAQVCAGWSGRSTERHTGPWNTRTRHPVLLINTRYDPATPYRNAVRVHRLLPNSALLTVDGVGHGGLAASSCAHDFAARYLLTGDTPAPGTVCPQDFQPFEPLPTAKAEAGRTGR